jgi:outer membrane protein assembly factor BamB
VGATSADVGGTYDTGAAYLFNASTGALVSKLLAPDRAEDDIFGASVALSDNYALVGAYGDANHGQQTGAAYLFDAQTGAFIRKLTAPDGHADSIFGWSVAVNDGLSIVSAGKQNTAAGASAGAVYIFDNGTGALLKEVFASDPAAFERFGIGLGADNETLAVGAPGGQFNATGAAYIIGIPEPTAAAAALLLIAGCAALRRGVRGRRI